MMDRSVFCPYWWLLTQENHWQLLGGRCLGYSQSPLQLRLPAGQHMLAVVVEDSLGAVRVLRDSRVFLLT